MIIRIRGRAAFVCVCALLGIAVYLSVLRYVGDSSAALAPPTRIVASVVVGANRALGQFVVGSLMRTTAFQVHIDETQDAETFLAASLACSRSALTGATERSLCIVALEQPCAASCVVYLRNLVRVLASRTALLSPATTLVAVYIRSQVAHVWQRALESLATQHSSERVRIFTLGLTNRRRQPARCSFVSTILDWHLQATVLRSGTGDASMGDCMNSASKRVFATVYEKLQSARETTRLRDQEHTTALRRHRRLTLARQERDRERWRKYARAHGIPLPQQPTRRSFVFYPGVDSPKSDVIVRKELKDNVEELQQLCAEARICAGFNTNGILKLHIAPRDKWTKWTSDPTRGLYINDMDVCAEDMDQCHRDAVCTSTGPTWYSCQCREGLVGDGHTWCANMSVLSTSADQNLTTPWDPVLRLGKRAYVFFPGLDTEGSDLFSATLFKDNTTALKTLCDITRGCVGFNTNGVLKSEITSSLSWKKWTDRKNRGLYVLDVDPCVTQQHTCDETLERCKKTGPGSFTCTAQSDETAFEPYDVILSSDAEHLVGLAAAIRSMIAAAADPALIQLHLSISDMSEEWMRRHLRECLDLDLDRLQQAVGRVEVRVFNGSRALDGIRLVRGDRHVVGNLASHANFARFFFHSLFPDVAHAVYIDCDTIVLGDVGELAVIGARLVANGSPLAAVPRAQPTYGAFFGSPHVSRFFEERYGHAMSASAPTFNAGVLVLNLRMWPALLPELLFWMRTNTGNNLYAYGTQPPLLLAVYRKWELLPAAWNVDGLGWRTSLPPSLAHDARLLHWSGRHKPWLAPDDALSHDLWLAHGGRLSTCPTL